MHHCRLLLAEAGAPDADLRAEALLAALAAEQVRYWVRDEGRALPDVRDALVRLTRLLTRGR